MMSDAGRRPYIAGNWKMHKTIAETREYVEHLLPRLPVRGGVDVGLCVPFTALATAVEAARDSELIISAQNMHQAPEGPYTGEVSAAMPLETDVRGGVPGISDGSQYFCVTHRALSEKLPAALEAALEPILCVG